MESKSSSNFSINNRSRYIGSSNIQLSVNELHGHEPSNSEQTNSEDSRNLRGDGSGTKRSTSSIQPTARKVYIQTLYSQSIDKTRYGDKLSVILDDKFKLFLPDRFLNNFSHKEIETINKITQKQIFLVCKGLSITSNLINIKIDCLLKGEDEKLNKYLGFDLKKDKYFNTMKNTIVGYIPLKCILSNLDDEIIQINQECKFIIERNGHILINTLTVGLYSLKSLEKIFNSYPEQSLNKTTKVTHDNGLLKISFPFNIGFDSYLFDCLGFEYKVNDNDVTKPNGEKYSKLLGYRWPSQEDIETGKTFFTATAEKKNKFK
ncbi:Hypothetical protein CINCED_3A017290 [Cinara cedri]|uniref:Uncharacterized protein n=1 Tax=Cinara cedri TaxID=506608 RepID=A0A5E4N6H1_9HEMI|nr:Hypothetical protein CINCED_3A017290 [Cinara cedri]